MHSNRREFLRRAAGIGIAAAALPVLSTSVRADGGRTVGGGRHRPGIAIQMYTLRDLCAQDFTGTLKRVAETGYNGVELGDLYGLTPAETRGICDDLGLTIVARHSGLPDENSVAQLVDETETFGAKWLVTGFGPGDMDTVDKASACASKLEKGAELLAPSGIGMVFHNHYWEFAALERTTAYEIILANAPKVGSELDIYWAAFAKTDPAEVLRKHGARVPLLHVKDGPLDDQPMTAVGQGKVDIVGTIKAADPRALHWLIVELDSCKTDMMQAAIESYQYLAEHRLGVGTR